MTSATLTDRPRKYRGFEIHHDYQWVATHPEYDGPEDNRIFHDPKIEGLHDQINGWIEEQAMAILRNMVEAFENIDHRFEPSVFVRRAKALLALDVSEQVG